MPSVNVQWHCLGKVTFGDVNNLFYAYCYISPYFAQFDSKMLNSMCKLISDFIVWVKLLYPYSLTSINVQFAECCELSSNVCLVFFNRKLWGYVRIEDKLKLSFLLSIGSSSQFLQILNISNTESLSTIAKALRIQIRIRIKLVTKENTLAACIY